MSKIRLHVPVRRNPVRLLFSSVITHWKICLGVVLFMALEVCIHVHSFAITRPAANLDPPFNTGRRGPVLNNTARANATLVMLARNSEVEGAVASVRNVQEQSNDNFGYPWVFLNDGGGSQDFVSEVSKAVGEGAEAHFHTIPKGKWGYPEWIDQDAARRRRMKEIQNQGIIYAGTESYHHMCRFHSGFFYDHPALLPYKWYWRIEPSITFTCAIPYDPFTSMSLHKKVYGYTIALWERGTIAPSLFRKLADYKARLAIPTRSLWTTMSDASYV